MKNKYYLIAQACFFVAVVLIMGFALYGEIEFEAVCTVAAASAFAVCFLVHACINVIELTKRRKEGYLREEDTLD